MRDIDRELAELLERGSHITITHVKAYTAIIRVRRVQQINFDRLQAAYGGYVSQSKQDGAWWFVLASRKAINALHKCYDGLVTKREHADLIFKLEESLDRAKSRKRSKGPLSQAIIKERYELIGSIQRLNSKIMPSYGEGTVSPTNSPT